MPRGARGFHSPRCLMEEIVVPPILKLVGSKKGTTVVGSSLVDSQQGLLEDQTEKENFAEELKQRMIEKGTFQATDIRELRRGEGDSAPEERKPSKEDLVENSVDAFNDNPLLSEPAAGLGNEFIVKQEWIEQCEKRKPPLKERYQL